VSDPADPSDPARPIPPGPTAASQAASPATPARPRRTPKFVLPDDHHDEDERTAERIEAFLDGPPASSRPSPIPEAAAARDRIRRPFSMDTRPDWIAALHHEGARHARYGRPASVLLVELTGEATGPALDRVARSVAELIRAQARETDRAMRRGVASFRVLMPETSGRAARAAADRLDRAFHEAMEGRTDEMTLRIDIATASRAGSLEDALSEAEAKLAGRLARAAPGPSRSVGSAS
jgi:hypothetical protein